MKFKTVLYVMSQKELKNLIVKDKNFNRIDKVDYSLSKSAELLY